MLAGSVSQLGWMAGVVQGVCILLLGVHWAQLKKPVFKCVEPWALALFQYTLLYELVPGYRPW